MPNWCNNNLIIKGDQELRNKFAEQVTLSEEEADKRGQRCDILGKLYPTPQELVDTVSGWTADESVQAEREKQYEANKAKYGSKDWYDWNCDHWGSKWGDCETYMVENNDSELHFSFASAWSPPLQGIAQLARMFPELRFMVSYDESGMGYFGVAVFSPDGEIDDNYREYTDLDGYDSLDLDSDNDDYWEEWEKLQEMVCEEQDAMVCQSKFYDLGNA